MPTVLSVLDHLPVVSDINALCVEYIECFIDQLFYRFAAFKKQFLLELRIMEAIEHDYFEDLNNLQPIEPIFCSEDCEKITEHDSEPACKDSSEDCEHDIEHDSEPEKTLQETNLEQLLKNLRIENNDNDEEKENQENEENEENDEETENHEKDENDGKDEIELKLAKFLSLLKLKDVEEIDVPLGDLDLGEMAAALSKLSLGVDSPDTFDQDLAVFGSDGNIAVEDTSVFAFLTKALLHDSAERELLRRLLQQTE